MNSQTLSIPDFTDGEIQLANQTLFERYGRLVPLQAADVELRLDAASEDLASCPSLYWEERGAHFVVSKTGESLFRCQFFYTDVEQFGTGREEYDNLGDCLVTLLRVQADHERERAGVRNGMTAVDFDKAGDDEEYHPPLII